MKKWLLAVYLTFNRWILYQIFARFLSDAEFALKCITAGGALLVFLIGLRQYKRAQLWKRKEFVGTEIKAFLGDSTVRNALLMIDWGSRRIPFDPESKRSTWTKVTRTIQVQALEPHSLRKRRLSSAECERAYTDSEVEIRDSYDRFLDGLERLNSFAEAGLFATHELAPYLEYWLLNIAASTGSVEDRKWRLALLAYIEYYRFRGAQNLLCELVGDVRVGKSIWESLRSADEAMAQGLLQECQSRRDSRDSA